MRCIAVSLSAIMLAAVPFVQERERQGKTAMTVSMVDMQIGSPTKPVLVVPADVNGRGPYKFALDTGASLSAISPQLAEELGIKGEEKREAMGAGGRFSVSLGALTSLSVGSAKRENLQVAIVDLSPLSQAAAVKLDGIIGFNYLKDFCITIDYPTKRLRVATSCQ